MAKLLVILALFSSTSALADGYCTGDWTCENQSKNQCAAAGYPCHWYEQSCHAIQKPDYYIRTANQTKQECQDDRTCVWK